MKPDEVYDQAEMDEPFEEDFESGTDADEEETKEGDQSTEIIEDSKILENIVAEIDTGFF